MLDDEHQYDLWVLELSSFQLDLTTSLKPAVATILNVTPDHLDRHHSLEAYIQAKQRIYSQAKVALCNRKDKATNPHLEIDCIYFGHDVPDEDNWGIIHQNNRVYLAKGKQCFLPVDSLLIKGVHNWLNALAACALAETVGIAGDICKDVLQTFPGLPH